MTGPSGLDGALQRSRPGHPTHVRWLVTQRWNFLLRAR